MRVLERLGAGRSPGRPVGLGKCCVYTHLNWCLLPACFSGLPLGLTNKALRAGAQSGRIWPHSWACQPRPFGSEVPSLDRLGAETPAGVHSCHHHQGHRHRLLLQAGTETVRAARSTNPTLLQFHPFIHPGSIYQVPPVGTEPCPAACRVTRQTRQRWVAAICHLSPSELLTLPYSPVDPGASLACTVRRRHQFLLCSDLPGDFS